jgi:hypothetical protein
MTDPEKILLEAIRFAGENIASDNTDAIEVYNEARTALAEYGKAKVLTWEEFAEMLETGQFSTVSRGKLCYEKRMGGSNLTFACSGKVIFGGYDLVYNRTPAQMLAILCALTDDNKETDHKQVY